MKVLFDVSFLADPVPSGVSRYAVELLSALKRSDSGVEPVCAVSGSPSSRAKTREIIRRRFPGHFPGRLQSCPGTGISGEFIRGALGPLARRSSKCRRALRKITNRLVKEDGVRLPKVDLFHNLFGLRFGRMRGTRTVWTVHDLFPLTFSRFFHRVTCGQYRLNLPILVSDPGPVICDSSWARDTIVRAGVSRKRCRVISLGVSDFFKPMTDSPALERALSKWNLEPGDYLLSVATFDPRKNTSLLLDCYSELVSRGNINWPLVLVGGVAHTGMYAQIRRRIARSKGRVILVGRVDDKELRFLYSGTGLFLSLSLSEGFGLTPLEAMRCGAPAIVSNRGSLPEVVGDAALQVSPERPREIMGAIRRVITNPGLRRELILKGATRAARFRWKKTATETAEVYREALKS